MAVFQSSQPHRLPADRAEQASFNLGDQGHPYFIYRLPTEVLEPIFIHCAYDYYTNVGHPVPTVPSWVNVTYVSRRWRYVALNCRSLWSHVFLTSLRWTKELLARSKQEPLKLHVNLHRRDKKRVLHIVKQIIVHHLERIEEFHVQVPDTFYYKQLFSIPKLSSHAPRLTDLKISIGTDLYYWCLVPFAGLTPALRTLDLSGCPAPWGAFKLDSLTTLSLCQVPLSEQGCTDSLLAALSCIPVLQHLYLEHAFRKATDDPWNRVPHSFNIPRLSRLLVIAPLSAVVDFLSYARIPLNTEVRLACFSEPDYAPDDFAPLYTLLAERFAVSEDQTPSYPAIRSLVIASAEGEVKLTFSAMLNRNRDSDPFISTSFTDLCWNCSVPLQVVVHQDRLRVADAMDHIVSNTCCSMALHNVENVHVVTPPFSSVFWRKMLGHLRGVRYLKLSSGVMPDLASVLTLASRDRANDPGPDQIYAPVLEVLELCNIVFSTPLETYSYTFAADVQSLCEALSTRKKPRGLLSVIRCTECNSDYEEEEFDMTGWWEGGRFHQ